MRSLLYGYLRDAYRDVKLFSVNRQRLYERVLAMATQGEWRPVVELLRDAIAEHTGIRDYIAGEKVLQGFLAAYLNLSQLYLFHSEMELNKGHADIVLEPFTARYPALADRYGYVIELKYLKRSALPAGAAAAHDAPPPAVAALLADARAQLRQYLADTHLRARHPSVRFIGLALVFHGWELVATEAVEADSGETVTVG